MEAALAAEGVAAVAAADAVATAVVMAAAAAAAAAVTAAAAAAAVDATKRLVAAPLLGTAQNLGPRSKERGPFFRVASASRLFLAAFVCGTRGPYSLAIIWFPNSSMSSRPIPGTA